jgi:hypothetical protein
MKPMPACWPTAWMAQTRPAHPLVNEGIRDEQASTTTGSILQASPSTGPPTVLRQDRLTRLGEVTFEVPQVRSGGFYPSALGATVAPEQAMDLAMAGCTCRGSRPAK